MSGFPVLDVRGDAFERGRIHGSLARARVERSLVNYRALFEHCGLGWNEAQAIAARVRPVIGRLDAALLEEIEGIAAGSERSVNEILALNARTEILPPTFPERATPQWLAQVRGGTDFGECTAIAVLPRRSATGETLLAQNWDWLGTQRGSLVLLRETEPEGHSLLTLTEAGMLAKIGLNSRGLGVCLNILRSQSDGLSPGVPVHVLLRRLLCCASVEEAESMVRGLRCGASSNILCADAAGHAACFELSPAGAAVVRSAEGTLCHTNHFIAASVTDEVALPPSLSSKPRLERALAYARAQSRHGLQDLQRMLRDESDGLLSICRHPDPALPEFARVESVASVIMELARGVMHVASDVPSRAGYLPVALAAEAVVA
jgi:isopenicillin-N N-acyltransferase like protein